jgi:sensor histidine kinase regulating citrate/malate metabolism
VRPNLIKNSFLLLIFSQVFLLLIAFFGFIFLHPDFHPPFTDEILTHLIMLIAFALSIIFIIVAAGNVSGLYHKEVLLDARSAMSESFASLAESINAQNSDFSCQTRIISGLVQEGRFDELSGLLEKIAGKINVLNSVLRIDNPIVGALLKAKSTEADIRHIRLVIDITTPLSGLGNRSLNIVRILGNLIDNAFDAVPQEEQERLVTVQIYTTGPLLRMEVSNRGVPLDETRARGVFEPGYTTKGEGHSGIGLHVVKALTEKMFGTVKIVDETTGTRFVVMLPGI